MIATAAPPAPGHNSELKPGERLEKAMDRWLQLDARKKRVERLMKLQAEEMARLVVHDIPTTLREMGATESTGPSGRAKAKTGVKVAGSLKQSPDPGAALLHLRESGFDAALAGRLVVDFLPDEEALGRQVLAEIAEAHGKEGTFEQSVHPQTLAAWARNRLAEGKPVDIELLGLTAWTEARVTALKAGR